MPDEILVFSKTADENHWNLMSVLKRVEDRGFTLSNEKSEFYKKIN